MPAPLFHLGADAKCPHQIPILFVPGNSKVLVGMKPVATMADMFTIAGCPFTIPPSKPQPCVKATLTPSVKVLINGSPAILSVGITVCQSPEQIPNGPAVIQPSSVQTKVIAT
jgi:hypothetical protein